MTKGNPPALNSISSIKPSIEVYVRQPFNNFSLSLIHDELSYM